MFLFYFSFALAVLSSAMYHVFIKLVPPDANPAISLFVSYATAALLCLVLLFFFPLKTSVTDAFRQLNWTSAALALALVGLEAGFLLAYRAGWDISLAAILVNVAVTVLLVPIGLLLFRERLTPLNMVGILLCIAGLVLANIKK